LTGADYSKPFPPGHNHSSCR